MKAFHTPDEIEEFLSRPEIKGPFCITARVEGWYVHALVHIQPLRLTTIFRLLPSEAEREV